MARQSVELIWGNKTSTIAINPRTEEGERGIKIAEAYKNIKMLLPDMNLMRQTFTQLPYTLDMKIEDLQVRFENGNSITFDKAFIPMWSAGFYRGQPSQGQHFIPD